MNVGRSAPLAQHRDAVAAPAAGTQISIYGMTQPSVFISPKRTTAALGGKLIKGILSLFA
jgi:hypothetical protein